jgi:biopolymer transport protein ExbD
MGFQLGEDHDSGMNEMNLIPLIDIMLVLMIIFLVTATVANPSIPLTLPKTTAERQPPPQKAMTISIKANGEIFLDGQNVSLQELETKLQDAAQASQKPTVQLEADEESKYNMVAKVMALASSAGLSDIAFVSEN